jgi:hypothetical protein
VTQNKISDWQLSLSPLTTTFTFDFPGLGGAAQDTTVSVPGATIGDFAFVTPASNLPFEASAFMYAWVSAADTVTVRIGVVNGSPNPPSRDYNVIVVKLA